MSTQKTELIRTSQSWDGAELPDYLPPAVRAAPRDGRVGTRHGTSLLGMFICPRIFEIYISLQKKIIINK